MRGEKYDETMTDSFDSCIERCRLPTALEFAAAQLEAAAVKADAAAAVDKAAAAKDDKAALVPGRSLMQKMRMKARVIGRMFSLGERRKICWIAAGQDIPEIAGKCKVDLVMEVSG